MRKIITYSTLGDNMKEVYSAANTWGDLQADLNSAGVRYEGMKVMTNPGQVTLESLQAELPEGDFQLFIMPQKVKSGYDGEHDDIYLIGEDGIGAEDEDWSENDPEDFTFRSYKDLAIARSKRAFALLEKAIAYMSGSNENHSKKSGQLMVPSKDPMLDKLRAQARDLQNNMNMFE